MSDTSLLQTILDGQTNIREDIANVREDVKKLDQKIDKVENRLNERLDKIGLQLAYLEDDTPTREEFDALVNKCGN